MLRCVRSGTSLTRQLIGDNGTCTFVSVNTGLPLSSLCSLVHRPVRLCVGQTARPVVLDESGCDCYLAVPVDRADGRVAGRLPSL